jgi:hypothetical protein
VSISALQIGRDCDIIAQEKSEEDLEKESYEDDDYNEQELKLSKFFRDWGESG